MNVTKNYINAIEEAIGKPGRILPVNLSGYHPIEGIYTLYEMYTGGFCIVFPLTCEGKAQKCIRLWHKDFDKGLVKKLADTLDELHKKVDFVIGFEYFEQGLRLDDDEVIPAVVMDWIDGNTLSSYILENRGNSSAINRLAAQFYDLCSVMRQESLAHGDLSSENIMVKSNGKMVLIDYDSFYAPALSTQIKQSIIGTPGFQHRQRAQQRYISYDADFFSQQIIYLALLAIARNSSLADEEKHLVGEKKMFFDVGDFKDDNAFVSSKGYKAIAAINDDEIKGRLAELRKAVSGNLSEVRSIVDYSSTIIHSNNIKKPDDDLVKLLQAMSLHIKAANGNQNTAQNRTRSTTTPSSSSTSTSSSSTSPRYSTSKTTITSHTSPAYKKWYLWAAIIAIAVVLYYTIGNKESAQVTAEDNSVVPEMVVSKAVGNIEGNYSLREKIDGVPVNGIRTCAIKKTSDNQGRILVTSEYDPEFIDFSFDAYGKVSSEQLGAGEITYNEKLNKTTITFRQGNRICKFIK